MPSASNSATRSGTPILRRNSTRSDVVSSSGPSKGETMGTCSWAVKDGGFHLSVIRAPQGAQREAGLAKLNESFQTLTAQGWTQEKKDFGNAKCVLMTPPQ